MVRGLYISASGMLNEMSRQNVVANNIANVNTSGFKRDISLSKAFPGMLINRIHDPKRKFKNFIQDPRPIVGEMGLGVNPDGTVQDFKTQAQFSETANPLDLAILGDGFFTVETTSGERYTRNGNFVLDGEHYLSTIDGHRVLGKNGPIKLKGSQIDIDGYGKISVDGEFIAQLRLVDFSDYNFVKMGSSLFAHADRNAIPEEINATIQTGTLEMSNVNVVSEMVELITITRAYDANQRAIHAQNEVTGRAINDVGQS